MNEGNGVKTAFAQFGADGLGIDGFTPFDLNFLG